MILQNAESQNLFEASSNNNIIMIINNSRIIKKFVRFQYEAVYE